ncbi:MAG: ROK family protein [Nanoarchaeota archaeon]
MAVIALDIGGTKIKGAIISPNYKIIKSIKVPTRPTKGKRHILSTIKSIVETLSANSQYKLTAIGVSLAGSIDSKGRLFDLNNTMPAMQGTYIRRFFSRLTDIPVFIENDANCFTLAECLLGKAQNNMTTIGIIWGSGVGAGMVTRQFNGKPRLYAGVDGNGLEIGHNKVFSKAYRKYVEMERVTGGKFLPRLYKQYGGTERLQSFEVLQGLDEASRKATAEAIEHLGYSIGLLINIFNPDRIVFGGGLSNMYESVDKRILSAAKKYCVKQHFENVSFSAFSLSDDEGIFGAAHLALKAHRKK